MEISYNALVPFPSPSNQRNIKRGTPCKTGILERTYITGIYIVHTRRMYVCVISDQGLSWWPNGKESACQCRRHGFDPWVWKIPWRRKWQPTPVFLPGESHGQRNLVGHNPWSRKESDTTERLHNKTSDTYISYLMDVFHAKYTYMYHFISNRGTQILSMNNDAVRPAFLTLRACFPQKSLKESGIHPSELHVSLPRASITPQPAEDA